MRRSLFNGRRHGGRWTENFVFVPEPTLFIAPPRFYRVFGYDFRMRRRVCSLESISSSFVEFVHVFLCFTEFYRLLPSFTEFYRVLPSFTEFYRVLPSFTEFYRV